MFGRITDKDGKALTDGDSAWSNAPDVTPDVTPDFTSLLKVGSKMYSLTHFEALPAAMYLSELAQGVDGAEHGFNEGGRFFRGGGMWNPCAATLEWIDLGHADDAAVVQHPFGESDEDKRTDPMEARGDVGVIGQFPVQSVFRTRGRDRR